ncbi:hypothetical protein HDU93_004623 [Gonapodya sp. JEL0774]|nr:hypothetical protein HDU93_004623 [Gonapodya sp. JEL0774]
MHNAKKPPITVLFADLHVEKNQVKYLSVLSCLLLYWWGVSLPTGNRKLRRHLGILRDAAERVGRNDTHDFKTAFAVLTAQRVWRGLRERRKAGSEVVQALLRRKSSIMGKYSELKNDGSDNQGGAAETENAPGAGRRTSQLFVRVGNILHTRLSMGSRVNVAKVYPE